MWRLPKALALLATLTLVPSVALGPGLDYRYRPGLVGRRIARGDRRGRQPGTD